MAFISSLRVTHFRCYGQAALSDLSGGPIVIYGPNGAGKTNLLEAVSLLVPGRGLRGVSPIDIQRKDSDRTTQPWAVAADIENQFGHMSLGTGLDPEKDKRLVRINGAPARGQSALAECLAAVWLTPQMDRLFLDSSGHRRRFLDRLVYAFDAAHAGRVSRFEKIMAQRSRLLKDDPNADPDWLSGLERTMAETGTAIAAARKSFLKRLQTAIHENDAETARFFPTSILRIDGILEGWLENMAALEAEDAFKDLLHKARPKDAQTGGAADGPHKSDLITIYEDKNLPADQCSTGEQKALLIGIILAHSRLIQAEHGTPPVLLLDEVAAHLDDARRQALYERLLAMNIQAWLTGTDRELFTFLNDRAGFFHVRDSVIAPE